jgi:hypothetical protein
VFLDHLGVQDAAIYKLEIRLTCSLKNPEKFFSSLFSGVFGCTPTIRAGTSMGPARHS